MKTIARVLLVVIVLADAGYSQNLNWRALGEDRENIVQLSFGYDYGVTAQLGYSRSFTLIRPMVVGIDYSFPMGDDLTDDFKIRLGGQIELAEAEGVSISLKVQSIFRRYQTQLVRIASFGADLGILAGYYSPGWYAAGEFGFDKSITSHFKHSDLMRASFPGIRDGWYIPTGGHFYYGIQGGKTIGESLELSVRAGATNAQWNDEEALLPYYFQLGVSAKF